MEVASLVYNSTHLECISPDLNFVGVVEFRLAEKLENYSSSALEFAYYTAPTVIEILGPHGTVFGGTFVTIVGTNFTWSSTLYCIFGSGIYGDIVPASFESSEFLRFLNSGRLFEYSRGSVFQRFPVFLCCLSSRGSAVFDGWGAGGRLLFWINLFQI